MDISEANKNAINPFSMAGPVKNPKILHVSKKLNNLQDGGYITLSLGHISPYPRFPKVYIF